MHDCAVYSINSYAEAVAFYEACPTRKGQGPHDERRIKGKKNSPQMGVQIVHNAVKFRYHRTDVVTWHPSNSYTVSTFESRSTCEFANRFLPDGHYLTRTGSVLVTGVVVHPVIGGIAVQGDNVTHEYPGTVFKKERVDRKAAKRVLAQTRYSEYREWHNAMWPMVRGQRMTSFLSIPAILEMLEDDSKWHEIMMSYEGHPDSIRKIIYSEYSREIYYDEVRETLPPGSNFEAWRVSNA
jgi:hypothetical protein